MRVLDNWFGVEKLNNECNLEIAGGVYSCVSLLVCLFSSICLGELHLFDEEASDDGVVDLGVSLQYV